MSRRGWAATWLPNWRRMTAWIDRQPVSRMVAAAVILSLGGGLPGFLYLRSPAWMLFWGGLFAGLWWLARDAEPLYEHDAPLMTIPKPVEDGPFIMMQLPGGSFEMGSPDHDDMASDEEKPQHSVTVSGFRIAITPVTAELYHEVMRGEAPAEGREKTPAVNVSWFDAIEFCNRLSKREGLRRCYYRIFKWWVCNWRAEGYRLPTEAEWEYACRAGSKTRYCFGDDPEWLDRYAWFDVQSAQEVAQKWPNTWGLYDMHGNVWEWCWDWYGPYRDGAVTDPRGPSTPGSNRPWRILRGGSFANPPVHLRSACRGFGRPLDRGENGGFRCVRVPQLMD